MLSTRRNLWSPKIMILEGLHLDYIHSGPKPVMSSALRLLISFGSYGHPCLQSHSNTVTLSSFPSSPTPNPVLTLKFDQVLSPATAATAPWSRKSRSPVFPPTLTLSCSSIGLKLLSPPNGHIAGLFSKMLTGAWFAATSFATLTLSQIYAPLHHVTLSPGRVPLPPNLPPHPPLPATKHL